MEIPNRRGRMGKIKRRTGLKNIQVSGKLF
jgi:hypothetical protein